MKVKKEKLMHFFARVKVISRIEEREIILK